MTAPALAVQVQGQSSVSADNLNTFAQTCDTALQLRNFIGTIGMEVLVRGRAAVNDGGAGAYYWDATSIGPDNGSTVIVPVGASSGAWILLYPFSDGVNPLTYGADPTGNTSSWTAFQLAVQAIPASGGKLIVTAGRYLLDPGSDTVPIALPSNIEFAGSGFPVLVINDATGLDNRFSVNGSNFWFHDFILEFTNFQTAQTFCAIYAATNLLMQHVRANGHRRTTGFYGTANIFDFNISPTSSMEYMVFDNCYFTELTRTMLHSNYETGILENFKFIGGSYLNTFQAVGANQNSETTRGGIGRMDTMLVSGVTVDASLYGQEAFALSQTNTFIIEGCNVIGLGGQIGHIERRSTNIIISGNTFEDCDSVSEWIMSAPGGFTEGAKLTQSSTHATGVAVSNSFFEFDLSAQGQISAFATLTQNASGAVGIAQANSQILITLPSTGSYTIGATITQSGGGVGTVNNSTENQNNLVLTWVSGQFNTASALVSSNPADSSGITPSTVTPRVFVDWVSGTFDQVHIIKSSVATDTQTLVPSTIIHMVDVKDTTGILIAGGAQTISSSNPADSSGLTITTLDAPDQGGALFQIIEGTRQVRISDNIVSLRRWAAELRPVVNMGFGGTGLEAVTTIDVIDNTFLLPNNRELFSGLQTAQTVVKCRGNTIIPAGTLNFATNNVNVSTDTITTYNHGFITGEPVQYLLSIPSNTAIGGLSDATVYYVIEIDNDDFQLATSSANAFAGTQINLTSAPSNQTQILMPYVAFDGCAVTNSGRVEYCDNFQLGGRSGVTVGYNADGTPGAATAMANHFRINGNTVAYASGLAFQIYGVLKTGEMKNNEAQHCGTSLEISSFAYPATNVDFDGFISDTPTTADITYGGLCPTLKNFTFTNTAGSAPVIQRTSGDVSVFPLNLRSFRRVWSASVGSGGDQYFTIMGLPVQANGSLYVEASRGSQSVVYGSFNLQYPIVTLTLNSTGSFTGGATITQATSGAKALITASTTTSNALVVQPINEIVFDTSDIITSSNGGDTTGLNPTAVAYSMPFTVAAQDNPSVGGNWDWAAHQIRINSASAPTAVQLGVSHTSTTVTGTFVAEFSGIWTYTS